jgi:TPR repeat protein
MKSLIIFIVFAAIIICLIYTIKPIRNISLLLSGTLFDTIHAYFPQLAVTHQSKNLDAYYDLDHDELLKNANAGDKDAQFVLADTYDNGYGIKQDLQQALLWYKKAAAQGQTDALNNLGSMFHHGDGVVQDIVQARTHYEQSAQLKNPVGLYNLARLYQEGHGGTADCTKAVSLMRRAVASNFPDALLTLGYWYDNGLCVKRSSFWALYYWRKAARTGDARAYFNIGIMYSKGKPVVQSDRKVFKHYLRAAELGHAAGMYNVGLYYEAGVGVQKDIVKAWVWYKKSERAGDTDAHKKYTEVEKILSAHIDTQKISELLDTAASEKQILSTFIHSVWTLYPEGSQGHMLARDFTWAFLEDQYDDGTISFWQKTNAIDGSVNILEATKDIFETTIHK